MSKYKGMKMMESLSKQMICLYEASLFVLYRVGVKGVVVSGNEEVTVTAGEH